MTTDDEAEFTALVLRQSRFVFRVAYAVLLNSHDAEDAVQETFLKLYRNRGWRHLDNECAFLARVAWRTVSYTHLEKIDIIEYSEEITTFAEKALQPAKVSRVSISDLTDKQLEVIVDDTQLSLCLLYTSRCV